MSAQDYAHKFWSYEKQSTCKGSTEPDQLWLSPEALSLLHEVGVSFVFAEHASVWVQLKQSTKPPHQPKKTLPNTSLLLRPTRLLSLEQQLLELRQDMERRSQELQQEVARGRSVWGAKQKKKVPGIFFQKRRCLDGLGEKKLGK